MGVMIHLMGREVMRGCWSGGRVALTLSRKERTVVLESRARRCSVQRGIVYAFEVVLCSKLTAFSELLVTEKLQALYVSGVNTQMQRRNQKKG